LDRGESERANHPNVWLNGMMFGPGHLRLKSPSPNTLAIFKTTNTVRVILLAIGFPRGASGLVIYGLRVGAEEDSGGTPAFYFRTAKTGPPFSNFPGLIRARALSRLCKGPKGAGARFFGGTFFSWIRVPRQKGGQATSILDFSHDHPRHPQGPPGGPPYPRPVLCRLFRKREPVSEGDWGGLGGGPGRGLGRRAGRSLRDSNGMDEKHIRR